MNNNVILTAQDRKHVYAIFEQVDRMISTIGDNHEDGDYMGAALEAVMRVQLYLEQKRKELAMEVE
jgi:hypothetical protein